MMTLSQVSSWVYTIKQDSTTVGSVLFCDTQWCIYYNKAVSDVSLVKVQELVAELPIIPTPFVGDGGEVIVTVSNCQYGQEIKCIDMKEVQEIYPYKPEGSEETCADITYIHDGEECNCYTIDDYKTVVGLIGLDDEGGSDEIRYA